MASPMVKTNEPGIYKRGSKYVVVFYAGGRQRKESAPTLALARKLKRKRQVESDEGKLTDAAKVRFAEFAVEWIERYHGKPGREFRESTRDDYRRDIKFSLEFFGPTKQLGQITPHDLSRFVNWLNDPAKQGKQFAPSTLRNKVAPLAACLGTAFAESLIPSNPALGVNYPGAKITATLDSGDLEGEVENETRALTREQCEWFIRVVPDGHRLLIEFAILTGLRVSEIRALQWRHLDLDGRDGSPAVRVRRQFYRERIQPPKSKQGRRDVPLTIDLADKLRRMRDSAALSGDLDLVFGSRTGKPFSASNVASRTIKMAGGEIGAPWLSWHSLRHTCASLLFAEGRNIVQVQRWLGHGSPDFTLRTYVHLLSDGVGDGLALGVATKVAMDPAETGVVESLPLAA